MAQKGKGLSGALSKMPREKAKERLSPGVYRSDRGNLVNRSGVPMRRPDSPPSQPPSQDAYRPLPGQFTGGAMPAQPMVNQPAYSNMPAGEAVALAQRFAKDPNQIQGGPLMVKPEYTQGLGAQIATAPNFNFNPMPQPSANNGGQYRLSPGVYGTREQAMQQYNQQNENLMPYTMPQQLKR